MTPTRPKKITGKLLVTAFKHVIEGVPAYKDKWFTAEDWCWTLPTFWGELRGREADIETSTFSKAMNSVASFGGDTVLRQY